MPGDQFGMLTVLGRDMFDYIRPDTNGHIPMYVCRCSCENQTIISVRKDMLLSTTRGTKSCGCLLKESKYKHGLNNTRLQHILDGMKRRCYCTTNDNYNNYKEHHIEICSEWMNRENGLKNFAKWAMSHGYRDDLTIDRIDNNGPYSPNNCRWVPQYVQANNTSSNVFYTYDGTTFSASCWGHALGIPRTSIRREISKGYTIDEIIKNRMKTHDINGIYFLNEYGLPYRPQDYNPYEHEDDNKE